MSLLPGYRPSVVLSTLSHRTGSLALGARARLGLCLCAMGSRRVPMSVGLWRTLTVDGTHTPHGRSVLSVLSVLTGVDRVVGVGGVVGVGEVVVVGCVVVVLVRCSIPVGAFTMRHDIQTIRCVPCSKLVNRRPDRVWR